ncbi:MAG: hypothetical protein HQL84_16495 [Magnetococcales bacterium]|nr:hypothetical protein [Magnetococcales bacterium]MBF0151620.1 hypothetical protein [Magnetococcales bacterium]MBF0172230.1 hypothetical protein [Magnetococcales bacterium]MBF0349134.1 hypothetical protein [Magnetococcales bacterium]
MKTNPALLLIPIVALLLHGCATMYPPQAVTNAALMDPAKKYEPTPAVELLEAPPKKSFVKIARMETLGNEGVMSEVFLLEDMRATARDLGAHAIIVPYGRVRKFSPDGMHWVVQGDAIRYQ